MTGTRGRQQLTAETELIKLWSKVLQVDISELTELDVLSCILYAGQNKQGRERMAYSLLRKYGSLSKVLSVPLPELRDFMNLSDQCAILIKTVAVAARFLLRSEVTRRSVIRNSQQLKDYFQAELSQETQEQFRVMFLDAKNYIITEEVVARGTVNDVTIYPREIIKNALSNNATALLVIHNHPSGDANPSEQDIILTKQLESLCIDIGIKLHDHVIVSNRQHFSMFEHGLLGQFAGNVKHMAARGPSRIRKTV